jgi:hypothetical protein
MALRAVIDASGEKTIEEYEPEIILPTIEESRAAMVLTPAQARVKLATLGMLANIETAISALPVGNLTRIYWYHATEFRRDDSLLVDFCTNQLGLTDTQIDDLFV